MIERIRSMSLRIWSPLSLKGPRIIHRPTPGWRSLPRAAPGWRTTCGHKCPIARASSTSPAKLTGRTVQYRNHSPPVCRIIAASAPSQVSRRSTARTSLLPLIHFSLRQGEGRTWMTGTALTIWSHGETTRFCWPVCGVRAPQATLPRGTGATSGSPEHQSVWDRPQCRHRPDRPQCRPQWGHRHPPAQCRHRPDRPQCRPQWGHRHPPAH